MKYLEILGEYQLEYLNAPRRNPYEYSDKKVMTYSNLLYFEGVGDEVFLIVPSIFNSYDILTIGSPNDLITSLRKMGSVYLVEWQEIHNEDFGLEDYAKVVGEVVCDRSLLAPHHRKTKVHLIGHCLGGNLAVAASLFHPNLIKSLVLLTTPWDFSHLRPAKALFDSSGLSKAVEGFDHIPAIYMQILFFLLSPSSLEQKLDFYQAHQADVSKSDFFAVERWQFSGHSIPKKTYEDLMNDWIDGKIFADGVMNKAIDPTKLAIPVMAVVCKKDKLVPPSSLGALCKLDKIVKYDTGHIGYLVGSKRNYFIKDLTRFVQNNSLS